ncbi:hypothetical protein PoB_003622500 [Plakobranchus ocellatus]|uniref:Uncharacterized protein n=1 Tax=Plakobranchus ocellatus TaxID=259542 RepID=A0AAV4AS58_9GAST|nr:hypothetical protein PoB_003622500 [Plakobranchus ocellatus]
MEPCGTPRRISVALEMLLLKDIVCTLSDKKDWRSLRNGRRAEAKGRAEMLFLKPKGTELPRALFLYALLEKPITRPSKKKAV